MASIFNRVRSGIISPLAAAVAVLVTSTASAHPGHGVTPEGDSVAHYLLEPVHGLGLVIGALVAITCVAMVRLRKGRFIAVRCQHVKAGDQFTVGVEHHVQ